MHQLKSKLPHIGRTIFTKMSQLAQEHQAINLSQGFPNFMPDKELIKYSEDALNSHRNQYAPLGGLPELRQKLSDKFYNLYHHRYDWKSEITITAGATQAIFTAISALVHRDDEVIVFKPAYDCYEPAVELYGGIVKPIQLDAPEYKIPWDKVKDLISDNTKLIIINTPHNPTGYVWTEEDFKQLKAVVKDTSTYILSDEVYEHMVFDDRKHHSICKEEELAARSIVTFSFGKTYHVTGWKLGYAVAPKAMMKEFRKVHQYNVFCVNHPLQFALSKILDQPEHYLNLSKFYQQKRDRFLSLIKNSRFKCVPTQGTYFQLADYTEISDLPDNEFCIELIKTHKLATIPVSVFNHKNIQQGYIRFCFAKTDETLEQAANIIKNI
ncbi:methionine aminotransferase [Psychroflexus sp. MBR-150]|jgi:methionine aminotransferase